MNKFWERFFYLMTYVTQGSSYLSPRAYAVLHRMHHAYSDTEKDPHTPHHTKNVMTMMAKTKNIYNDVLNNRSQHEERFDGNIPMWSFIEKLGDSWFSRIAWGTFYVFMYVNFVPEGMWYLYLLLPVQFLMGPTHGAIVNWSGHMYGYQNFNNNDKSRNSLPLDIIMMGELFQNNHHKLPRRINFAAKWWEFDPTYPVIVLLHKAHIIRLKSASVKA